MAGKPSKVGGIKIDLWANTARLSADMAKAAGILTGFERQVNKLSGGMKAAISGITLAGAAYGVKQFSDAVFNLAEAGDKAGDIQQAFIKLGGSSEALDLASERTQGLIEKFDLMKAANDALIKGLPDVNKNFADLADLATRVASARDLDPLQTLQELIGAISSGKGGALKQFGIDIGDAKGKTEGLAAAMNGLQGALGKFEPVSLGVSDSLQVFKNTLSEAVKNIGIGVDSSAVLAAQFQELKIQTDPQRMQAFGMALAEIESVFLSLAGTALPVAIELLNNFALGLDRIFRLTKQGKFTTDLTQQQEITKNLQYEKSMGKVGLDFRDGLIPKINFSSQANLDELDRQIQESLIKEQDILNKYAADEKQAQTSLLAEREKNAEEYRKRQTELFKKFGFNEDTGKYTPPPSSSESSGIRKKQAQLTMKDLALEADQFRVAIEGAIQRVDPAAFAQYRTALYANTEEAFLAANQTLVTEGLKTQEELGAMARAEADKTVRQYDEQMQSATMQHAEMMRQAHEQAAQQWSGVLDQLFNPQEYSWEDSLKQLANGFASEILAGLVGGIDQNLTSFQGIGKVIGQAVLAAIGEGGGNASGAGWGNSFPDLSQSSNGQSGSVLGQVFDLFGSLFSSGQSTSAIDEMFNPGSTGISTGAAYQSGIQGPGGPSGQFNSTASMGSSYASMIQAGIGIFTDALAAQSRDKASQSNAGTGMTLGGTAGAILGGIFGGPQGASIGQAIGSAIGGFVGNMFQWGAQNPETKARHAFANFIEEGFKKLETIAFFDAQGKLRQYNAKNLNFVEGSTGRFNPNGDTGGTNWGDNFKKMGDDVVRTFSGLGQAFEEVLGLTEDVGSQIGYILAENLAGNIDNARLLVQQLGLDMQDMIDKLIEAGKTGEMSWLEVEGAIQAVNQAFEQGLVAVGNVTGAWEEFIGSGGRGMAALKGVKDLAIEAMEAGAKSLEDLKARLIQAGANPEAVEAFIAAVRGRGITSLQQLADANDRTLGGIVADTNAASSVITEQWSNMSNKVDEFKKTLEDLDEQMTKELVINVKTNFDENTQKAMDQGVYNDTPAERLQSEPIADTSSRQARYRHTVSDNKQARASAMVVNIDARGAEKGVHNDLMTAMAVMEQRIVTRTANIMYEQMGRGL